MNRISVVLCLCAVWLIVLPYGIVDALDLADVKHHWSQPYVAPLVARNVIGGYPDGRFYPDNYLTRVEWVKMLVSALDVAPLVDVADRTWPQFADVPSTHWGRPYVEAAWELGWVQGVGAAVFGPDRQISRAEAVTMLMRVLDETGGGAPGERRFTDDAAIPGWARPSVYTGLALGFLQGYADGSFRPLHPITRGEAAAILYRVLTARAGLYDLKGIIVKPPVVTESVQISVELDGGGVAEIAVPAHAYVIRNGQQIPPDQLGVFDQVALILANGAAAWVEAWSASASGMLVEPIGTNRQVRIRNDYEEQSYSLWPGAVVFRNGAPAKLEHIQPGDKVYLILDHNERVRGIDAVRPDVEGRIWGRYQSPSGEVRLRIGQRYTGSRWFTLSERAILYVDGDLASWKDLRLGDTVTAARDARGVVIYLESFR